MTFKRTTENFTCEKCDFFTEGNGYTNHCPQCLWSKHVDIFPGDRAGTCSGMMQPIGVNKKGGEYIITHQCIRCGFVKTNKAVPEDSFDMIIQISVGDFKLKD